MASIVVDSLRFDFPEGWKVEKYDDWAYYRNQFHNAHIKGIDLLAIAPDKTLWLIEAKDYRQHPREKSKDPIDSEIQFKIVDSLAALLPASLNATNVSEKQAAANALRCKKIRVVFHCEQPTNPSRLRPTSFNSANLQKQLRILLRAVDPHLKVVDMRTDMPWRVRSNS